MLNIVNIHLSIVYCLINMHYFPIVHYTIGKIECRNTFSKNDISETRQVLSRGNVPNPLNWKAFSSPLTRWRISVLLLDQPHSMVALASENIVYVILKPTRRRALLVWKRKNVLSLFQNSSFRVICLILTSCYLYLSNSATLLFYMRSKQT